MLKKAATKSSLTFPKFRAVGLHRHTTSLPESLDQLVEWPYLCQQQLICSAEEEGATFLGEHRDVLRWQREALTDRIIRQVASAGHLAEPLTSVAFIDMRTIRQLNARSWSFGQLFEEAEAITDTRHHRCDCTDDIGDRFAHECLDFRLIDNLLCCHVFSPSVYCFSLLSITGPVESL